MDNACYFLRVELTDERLLGLAGGLFADASIAPPT